MTQPTLTPAAFAQKWRFRREMQVPAPAGRIIGPISTIVAPIAGLLGFRGRYDEYSG